MATYTLRNLINSTVYFPDIGLEIGPLEDLDVSEFNREQFSLSPSVQACVQADECVLVLSDNTQLSKDDTIRAFNNYLGNPVDIYYDQDEMDYLMVGDGSAATVDDYFYIPTSPPMKPAGEEWPGLLPLLRTKFDEVNDNFNNSNWVVKVFSRSRKFKNKYLELSNIPTSQSPYYVMKNSLITKISVIQDNSNQFDIEIYKNGTLLETITWLVTDDSLKEGLSLSFLKDDKISIYCSSSSKCQDMTCQILFEASMVTL